MERTVCHASDFAARKVGNKVSALKIMEIKMLFGKKKKRTKAAATIHHILKIKIEGVILFLLRSIN